MAYHMWNIDKTPRNKAQYIHSQRIKTVEYFNKEIVWQPNAINIRQLCEWNDDDDDDGDDDGDDDRIEHISYTYDICYRPKQRIEENNMLTKELTFRLRSHTQKKRRKQSTRACKMNVYALFYCILVEIDQCAWARFSLFLIPHWNSRS